jgi:hypothetical protein
MTNTQAANPNGEAEDAAQNKVSPTSTTSDKDALGDSSLDKVSGGGWPYATMKSAQVTPTI